MGETSGSSYQVININNFTAFDNQTFNLYRYTHYAFLKIVAPRNGSSFTVTEHATLVINGQGTTVVNVGFGEYTLTVDRNVILDDQSLKSLKTLLSRDMM